MTLDDTALGEARARYFAENGFAADGGYDDPWVRLQVGPIALRIPNTPARVHSVRYHDLHHVLTGYQTHWTGEGQIAAWEIASGCAGHHAAWVLNLWAMAIGLCIAPRAVARAFVRGRRTRNLYPEAWDDAWLQARVGDVRRRLGLDEAAAAHAKASGAERATLAAWSAGALSFALTTLALVALPIVLAATTLL
jgi:hypothetical protein